MDEKKNIGIFSAIGIEEVEWGECISAWSCHFMDELETRKYNQDFNQKIFKVYDWVFAHRKEAFETTLEQQEERMIIDGVLTREDI